MCDQVCVFVCVSCVFVFGRVRDVSPVFVACLPPPRTPPSSNRLLCFFPPPFCLFVLLPFSLFRRRRRRPQQRQRRLRERLQPMTTRLQSTTASTATTYERNRIIDIDECNWLHQPLQPPWRFLLFLVLVIFPDGFGGFLFDT